MKELNELLREQRADFGIGRQNTLPGLYDLIQYVKESCSENLMVIEVGSFAGVSTELFAMTCKMIHAVDGWDLAISQNGYDGIPEEWLRKAEIECREKLSHYPNVIITKEISANAHTSFENGVYDLVYIDADHKEQAVIDDITWWMPKVRQGGFIAGHDYSNIYTVRNAVDSIFGKPDKIFGDCSWLKKCI